MNTSSQNENDGSISSSPENVEMSQGIDRRTFIIRNAVIGAAAVMTGKVWTPEARAAQATAQRHLRAIPSSQRVR